MSKKINKKKNIVIEQNREQSKSTKRKIVQDLAENKNLSESEIYRLARKNGFSYRKTVLLSDIREVRGKHVSEQKRMKSIPLKYRHKEITFKARQTFKNPNESAVYYAKISYAKDFAHVKWATTRLSYDFDMVIAEINETIDRIRQSDMVYFIIDVYVHAITKDKGNKIIIKKKLKRHEMFNQRSVL